MKQTTLAGLLAAVVLLGLTASSNGDIIELDDPIFGPGSITRDTASGLDWLDLTETINRSANDVAANFGPGGDFEGFRFAMADEVFELFINAGIPDVPGSSPANIAPAQALMEFIGSTAFAAGIGNGNEALGNFESGQRIDLDGFFNLGVPNMRADFGPWNNPDVAFDTVANWVVRVPSPGAAALLGAGALAGLRRRRR